MDLDELRAYLREPDADGKALQLIVDLTNGLVEEALSPEVPWNSTEVRLIRFKVAARAWSNPLGARSITERIDDYSSTVQVSGRQEAGVYLTDSERRVLAGAPAEAAPVEWSGSLPYAR